MWKRVGVIILAISIALFGCSNGEKGKKEIDISVASSLLEPIEEIVKEYETNNNVKVNINSGASGELKNQIIQGAEVGLFFSANNKYVDDLISLGFVDEDNNSSFLGNKLVLIKNNLCKDDFKDINDLENIKGNIAIGEITLVPAGEYAKEALINIGLWNDIENKIIYTKSANVVKTYVENGSVEYGFVYKSDCINLKNSSIVYKVPEDKHNKINYSLVLVKGYKYEEDCEKLMEYIKYTESIEIFKKYGFVVEEER